MTVRGFRDRASETHLPGESTALASGRPKGLADANLWHLLNSVIPKNGSMSLATCHKWF